MSCTYRFERKEKKKCHLASNTERPEQSPAAEPGHLPPAPFPSLFLLIAFQTHLHGGGCFLACFPRILTFAWTPRCPLFCTKLQPHKRFQVLAWSPQQSCRNKQRQLEKTGVTTTFKTMSPWSKQLDCFIFGRGSTCPSPPPTLTGFGRDPPVTPLWTF